MAKGGAAMAEDPAGGGGGGGGGPGAGEYGGEPAAAEGGGMPGAAQGGGVTGAADDGGVTGVAQDGGVLGDYADRVLEVVEAIPEGRVLTYGDVAAWLGEGGPRQVGRVMARYGGAVPWWRVVRSDGVLLAGHERSALARYRAEGTPLRDAGRAGGGRAPRLDMARARWGGHE